MYHFTIGLFIAVIISAVINVANAAETRPYMYRAQQTAQLQELINRGSVPVTYETVATTPAGQQVTRYTTRPTVLNATRLGALTRGALGGPLGLGITAAIVAAGYIYDNDTGDIIESTQGTVLPPDVPSRCAVIGRVTDSTIKSAEACRLLTETYHPEYPIVFGSVTQTQGEYRQQIQRIVNGSPAGTGYFAWPLSYGPIDLPQDVIIDDSGLGDIVSSNPEFSPDLVTDIINSPIQSGTWPDRWPEMVPTVQDISDNLGHEIEGAPAPVNPDQTIIDGSTARPSPSGSGGSAPPQLPAFCSWVPNWLCNLMDLPENPDVPFVDIDEPDDFNSGIGTGSCPPDIMISLGNYGSVPISWEYPCELASTFKPVVLFFAWITALYIVVRVK